MLQHQGEDPTRKPNILICSINPIAVYLRGHQKEVPHTSQLTGVDLLLAPVYSEARAKASAEVSLGLQSPYGKSVGIGIAKDPQNTIFLLTGRRTRQTCGSENQRC
ncbi:hypothetical protein TNCV_382561 [Trichonephila clavipes]|nr:hypothetical protein TNCV_382561 [Trichonephila clavipes]